MRRLRPREGSGLAKVSELPDNKVVYCLVPEPRLLIIVSEGLHLLWLWDEAAITLPTSLASLAAASVTSSPAGRKGWGWGWDWGSDTEQTHTLVPNHWPSLFGKNRTKQKNPETLLEPAAVTHLHLLDGVDQRAKGPFLHQLLPHHSGPDHCRKRQDRGKEEVREA